MSVVYVNANAALYASPPPTIMSSQSRKYSTSTSTSTSFSSSEDSDSDVDSEHQDHDYNVQSSSRSGGGAHSASKKLYNKGRWTKEEVRVPAQWTCFFS